MVGNVEFEIVLRSELVISLSFINRYPILSGLLILSYEGGVDILTTHVKQRAIELLCSYQLSRFEAGK